jgi:hypothetical protein
MYININKVTEQKDGSALLDISYDKELENFVKTYYKKKRITKSLMEKFVIEGLTNYMEKYNDK